MADAFQHTPNGLCPPSVPVCHQHSPTSSGWNLALPSHFLGLHTVLLTIGKSPSGPNGC